MDSQIHWDTIYGTKQHDSVSWYSPHLAASLSLIEQAAPNHSASILDVGGGQSTLVEDLLARGYRNLTVIDISANAIQQTQARLGAQANSIRWLIADVTQATFEARSFDVWHDRACFHFLTVPDQRAAYIRQVSNAVRHGGHVILSTFGLHGPQKCSGLDVVRYSAASLLEEFGPEFQLAGSSLETHQTPAGATQQFLYCHFIME